MTNVRIEKDSMGDVQVPAQAYYGAQTQRAVENFPISGWNLPPALIRALGLVKLACATANRDLGKLTKTGKNKLNDQQVEMLLASCREVAEGKFDNQFPIDVFQTGSGTSSNMNANEVIANRAIELLGGTPGSKKPVHPNDHVNRGQSSNDVMPTAVHLAAAEAIDRDLLPALRHLHEALAAEARELDPVVKVGRTHLMDAGPIRLGQEFSGSAAQVAGPAARVEATRGALAEL